jgi:Flp pilus assembly secretin CpaC
MTFRSVLSDLGPVLRSRAGLAALVLALTPYAASADNRVLDVTIDVVLDQSRLVKLPERAATIIIGNPLIADAALQAGGLMVLTGKGYGSTNLIALDRKGNVLMEKDLIVHGAERDTVVVYRGAERNTYSCAPDCQPRVTLGDGQEFFAQTLTQTTTRNSQAISMTGQQR